MAADGPETFLPLAERLADASGEIIRRYFRADAGDMKVEAKADETPVTIAPGATRQVQLALKGRQDNAMGGKATNPPPTPAPNKKTGTLWDNPLTATLIVVGGAVVTGLIIDAIDDDDNDTNAASPSNP